jgi:predicted Zn-dependent protease
LKQNILDKAAVEFAIAVKVAPQSFEARLGQASMFARTDKADQAYAICQELMASFGDRAELYLLLGKLLAQRGKTRDAVEAWQKAVNFTRDPVLRQQATKAIDAALQWQEVAG